MRLGKTCMRYRHLDLNLLFALDALLSECSVTRAAERLCLGQSATSSALGRLREHFNDPLLVQVGRSMQPTALGLQLLPKVQQALALTRDISNGAAPFDPLRCERRFTLVASDYIAAVLLPALSRALAQAAPGVRLTVRDLPLPRDGDVVSEALDYRRSDVVIVPQRRLNSAYGHQALLTDQLCCLVDAAQAQYADGISLASYCDAEHVLREFADGRNLGLDAAHLHELGIVRRVAVAVESFALMPDFLIGTARVATVFRRQALAFAQRYPLRVLPAPLEFPDATQVVQWHPYQDQDPALNWFRQVLQEQAARLA